MNFIFDILGCPSQASPSLILTCNDDDLMRLIGLFQAKAKKKKHFNY